MGGVYCLVVCGISFTLGILLYKFLCGKRLCDPACVSFFLRAVFVLFFLCFTGVFLLQFRMGFPGLVMLDGGWFWGV